MDDIDKTFDRLRRVPIDVLLTKCYPVIDPVSFVPRYTEWNETKLGEYGWAIDEANKALKEHFYGK
jgi:hypothetical protein